MIKINKKVNRVKNKTPSLACLLSAQISSPGTISQLIVFRLSIFLFTQGGTSTHIFLHFPFFSYFTCTGDLSISVNIKVSLLMAAY